MWMQLALKRINYCLTLLNLDTWIRISKYSRLKWSSTVATSPLLVINSITDWRSWHIWRRLLLNSHKCGEFLALNKQLYHIKEQNAAHFSLIQLIIYKWHADRISLSFTGLWITHGLRMWEINTCKMIFRFIFEISCRGCCDRLANPIIKRKQRPSEIFSCWTLRSCATEWLSQFLLYVEHSPTDKNLQLEMGVLSTWITMAGDFLIMFMHILIIRKIEFNIRKGSIQS